jgi:hypothetical protein
VVNEAFIAVMDCLVCVFTHANQIFRIQQVFRAVPYVIYANRVHVMNHNPTANLVSCNSHIAAAIPNNNIPADPLPLTGPVEHLVKYPIKPKRLIPNPSAQLQISIPRLVIGDLA